MAKGQHEEMLESLARIEEILKKPPQPIHLEVKCCCGGENSATKEEVEAILGPVLGRLKAVTTNPK